jgi:hypothetical protein
MAPLLVEGGDFGIVGQDERELGRAEVLLGALHRRARGLPRNRADIG